MKTRKTIADVVDKEALKRLLLSKISTRDDGCQVWTGAIGFSGYGQLSFEGKTWSAHRVAYEISNGAIPHDANKWWVLHTCDNPSCCNPDHLYLGDAKDNANDMIDRKRQRMGFKRHGWGESTKFGRVFYEIGGEIKTIFEWGEFFDVNPCTLEQRISAGWPEKDLGLSSKAYKRHMKSDGKTKYKRFSGLKEVEDYKNETSVAVTTEASISTNRDGNIDMASIAKAQPDFTSFIFENHDIRVVTKDGEPWFVADDVCKALNLSNPSMSLKSLDDDERSKFNLGRQGEANIVSESGMYTLVLRCRDAVNKGSVPHTFRKWVTAEVLPSIRKTGKYEITVSHQIPPAFRYIVTLNYRDVVTGQEETLKGGCNTPEEIIRGTAKKFGIFVSEMQQMPVNAFY
ncbi:hypothetical protein JMY69_000849 [Salmonella enterica]|nr:hypothetical protein [Salmonella enterica]